MLISKPDIKLFELYRPDKNMFLKESKVILEQFGCHCNYFIRSPTDEQAVEYIHNSDAYFFNDLHNYTSGSRKRRVVISRNTFYNKAPTTSRFDDESKTLRKLVIPIKVDKLTNLVNEYLESFHEGVQNKITRQQLIDRDKADLYEQAFGWVKKFLYDDSLVCVVYEYFDSIAENEEYTRLKFSRKEMLVSPREVFKIFYKEL